MEKTSIREQNHGHIRALDGLRGVAVLLVFMFHALSFTVPQTSAATRWIHRVTSRGWIGVDLFFVLSGFLITTILLNTRVSGNYYKVFYLRRLLRIFPLYYLTVLGFFLLTHQHLQRGLVVLYCLNLSNLASAFNPLAIPYLTHLWSLAIEEQFYFVWPSFVRRFQPQSVGYGCVAVIAGLFVFRNLEIAKELNNHWPEILYRLTPFRIDTLCSGALLAIVVYSGVDLSRYRTWLRMAYVGFGLAYLFAAFAFHGWFFPRFGYTAVALCFASLIALALNPDSFTAKLTSNAFLRQLGKYSYCFYLLHVPVVIWVSKHYSSIHTWATVHLTRLSNTEVALLVAGVEFAVTFGISAISWNFFEGPILRLKRHFRYQPIPEHYLG